MIPTDRAFALGFGEFGLHSYLGQPLRASVAIDAEPGEQPDISCFSLGKSGERADNQIPYLTQASLVLEEKRGRLILNIATLHPISEPYVKILVNANCGQGRFSHEFTALLDPEDDATQAASGLSAPLPVVELKPETAPAGKARSATGRRREKVREGGSSAVHEEKKASPRIAGDRGEFQLKLSTSDLDLSAVGKLTEAERQKLREMQLLQDADDQVASVLAMKNRIKQLETQLSEMRTALNDTNSRLALSEKIAAPPVPKTQERGVLHGGELAGGTEYFSLRNVVGTVAVLALMVTVWWRWRRRRVEERLEFELEHEFSPDTMERYSPEMNTEPLGAGTEPALGTHTIVHEEPEPQFEEEELFHPTSAFDARGGAVTFTEAESVVDEADLYLAYGWGNRAIDLLQGYLEHHLDDTQLWKKLFETYCSQGMKAEFEQLALRSQTSVQDPELWRLVQKLGRQLDPQNALYHSDEPDQISAPSARPEAAAPASAENAPLDIPLEFVFDDTELAAEKGAVESSEPEDPLGLDELLPQAPELGEAGLGSSGNQKAKRS